LRRQSLRCSGSKRQQEIQRLHCIRKKIKKKGKFRHDKLGLFYQKDERKKGRFMGEKGKNNKFF